MNSVLPCNEYNTESSRASSKVRIHVSPSEVSKNEKGDSEKTVTDDQCHESLLDIHGLLELVNIIKGIKGETLPLVTERPVDPTRESARVRKKRGR